MKKFRLFAALLVVAWCVSFSACGNNSLVGTTWVGHDDGWTIAITFTNEEFGTWVESHQGSSNSSRFYSTFNDPNITIRVQVVSSRGFTSTETYRGVISGRVMTLTDEEGHTIVFNRDATTSSTTNNRRTTTNAGVVVNGVRWATSNVDTPGTFARNPQDAGGYFTWEEAQNACPPGWRLPTIAELDALVSAGSEWTSRRGVNGLLFGSGRNQVFLPAAGDRCPHGNEVVNVGISGAIRSSCALLPHNRWLSGGLNFGNLSDGHTNYLFIDVGTDSIGGDYAGHNVRCVAE